MLLTLSTTMPDATDLGFLLHKHPDRAQSFDVAVGTAHVLWPRAHAERSTVALLLEVDPVALVRGRGRDGAGPLSQYVNDRPYAASSMLAVALGTVFRTAMTGRCDARPELAGRAVPLQLDRMPDTQRARLELLKSSVTYRDDRLAGHDAVVLMEVVEHVDPARLPALERSVFAHARPVSVLVTTPNAEHNVRYGLPAGATRHRDHRFEWTREQFCAWAGRTAAAHGYTVRHLPVGDDDPQVGPPTELAVFRRAA